MNIRNTQLPERFRCEIQEQLDVFAERRSFEERRAVPDTTEIPIQDKTRWFRIRDVICVYVDMMGSTQLSASAHESSTAGAYQLFTGTAVALFDAFNAPYIDIKGDGVFALFNANQPYRALAAAVTFKTFSEKEFVPRIKDSTGLGIGCHIGIDRKLVLVRKLGLKRFADRTDRQNEVWAGKPVNMASKLAAKSADKELLVSERFYSAITDNHARLSCGCSGGVPSTSKVNLWTTVDVSQDSKFDFATAYSLKSNWCDIHGANFCEKLLTLDPS
jgi:class 3 adenylate cyclase